MGVIRRESLLTSNEIEKWEVVCRQVFLIVNALHRDGVRRLVRCMWCMSVSQYVNATNRHGTMKQ